MSLVSLDNARVQLRLPMLTYHLGFVQIKVKALAEQRAALLLGVQVDNMQRAEEWLWLRTSRVDEHTHKKGQYNGAKSA